MKNIWFAWLLPAVLAVSTTVHALTIDFEGLASLEPVTTQFPGLTFANTVTLRSGISLNELDFPPRSGLNVVSNLDFLLGPITIDFATPVSSVQGFFTYSAALTLTAYDAALNPVSIDTSDFSANLVSSGVAGSSPNELLQVAFAGGIARVTVGGAAASFTLDDLTAVPRQVAAPATTALLGIGLLALATGIRRRKMGPPSLLLALGLAGIGSTRGRRS